MVSWYLKIRGKTMKPMLVVFIATFAAIFVSCNTTTQQVSPSQESRQAQIQQNIDPEIQGENRRVIAEYMDLLPQEQWKEAIYIRDGHVYVNHLRLQSAFTVAEPVDTAGGV
jgi:hypothetical protein